MSIKHKKLHIFGIVIGITSLILASIWYDWKLVVIIILALYGNNITIWVKTVRK